MVAPDTGVLGGVSIKGPAVGVATVAFVSITLYNAIELSFIIFATFKKRSGLYFWSFLIATVALFPQGAGLLLKNLSLSNIPSLPVTLMLFSWPAMECIISGLYIWKTAKLRKLENGIQVNGTAHRIIMHLLIVNVIVILLDISILALEYAGLYYIQTTWKALVYSVKLKLEFSILNKLVDLVHEHPDLTLTGNSLTCPDEINMETLSDGRRRRSIKNTASAVGYNPGGAACSEVY
ncbi:hypothetical protein B7463_g6766, partial [Scytalidium lignicola]